MSFAKEEMPYKSVDGAYLIHLGMEFSHLVLERLDFVFNSYGFRIVEQSDNYVRLESNNLVIIIVHNQLENSNTLWMGRNDEKIDKVEIDNDLLKLFFNSDLQLSQVPVDKFINNLGLFFEKEGRSLLIGNIATIDELEIFDLERSRKYTQDLMENQNLNAANKAWKSKNYGEFINIINQSNKGKLPPSFLLRYKIAIQKV